jgi:hypothetical protein
MSKAHGASLLKLAQSLGLSAPSMSKAHGASLLKLASLAFPLAHTLSKVADPDEVRSSIELFFFYSFLPVM